jgi:hypothetical protein
VIIGQMIIIICTKIYLRPLSLKAKRLKLHAFYAVVLFNPLEMHMLHVKIIYRNLEYIMKHLFLVIVLSLTQAAWAQSIFTNTNHNNDGELTAQEEHEAANYIHQGRANETYQEICTGKHNLTKDEAEDICTNGENAFDGQMRMLESMMPMVNKAYSMVGMTSFMGGGNGPKILGLSSIEGGRKATVFKGKDGKDIKPTGEGDAARYEVTDKDGNKEFLTKDQMKESEDYERKEKDQKDLCALIPGVTDLAATTMQGMENQQIQQNYANQPQAPQAEALYALANSHKTRKKTSTWQASGWTGTVGCYLAYAATGTSMDVNYWIKLGLATGAGTFYWIKQSVHGKKAALLEKLAKQMPKAGECNPHTDTQCFCNEPSSVAIDLANYQKYCVPEQYAKSDDPLENKTSCIDAQGKPDPSCKCKKRRSCFDSTISKEAINVGLNPAVMRDATGGLTALSNGFDSSTLGPGIEQTLAMAKKHMKKFKPKNIPNLRGNGKAQKLAKSLESAGIPRALAATIAARKLPVNGNASAPALAAASLRDDFGSKNAAFGKGGIADPKFKSGGSDASRSKGKTVNPFAFKRGGSSAQGSGGVQNVDYSSLANKATRDADITKDSSRGIFDILSHRYKMRAWKEFEDTITKEVE